MCALLPSPFERLRKDYINSDEEVVRRWSNHYLPLERVETRDFCVLAAVFVQLVFLRERKVFRARYCLLLSDKVHQTSYSNAQEMNIIVIQLIYRITQSVGATGGVYKGQGHNQYKLMTCSY